MIEVEEIRRSLRREVMYVFTFAIQGREGLCHGFTGNVSESGFMMHTVTPVCKGDIIRITRRLLFPFTAAQVRWAKMADELWHAGVEGIDAETLKQHFPFSV